MQGGQSEDIHKTSVLQQPLVNLLKAVNLLSPLRFPKGVEIVYLIIAQVIISHPFIIGLH